MSEILTLLYTLLFFSIIATSTFIVILLMAQELPWTIHTLEETVNG